MQHGWLVGFADWVIGMSFFHFGAHFTSIWGRFACVRGDFLESLGPIRCVWVHLEDLGRVPGSSLGHLVHAWEVSGRILKPLGVISGTLSVPKTSKKYSWMAFG